MKALRFARTGDLKYLELVEGPAPKPGDGEILVKVMAAGLNKSDVSNVLGRHPHTTLPRTPGRDFSGVVVAGPGNLLGKEVWGTGKGLGFTRDGSHAEYLAVPADGVSAKPKSLSFAQAASCGVPYTTAWKALERAGVAKGGRLLVVGAAGAVGGAAMALARWRGAEVAGAVRRAEQASAISSRGIPSILLSGQRSLAEALKEIFAGGADVVFDTTGFWLAESVKAVAPFGRVAVIVAPGDGQVTVPVRELYRKSASIVGANSMLYGPAECAQILAEIGVGFDAGGLPRPGDLRECPLEKAPDAYADVNRGTAGRFVFLTA